MKNSFTHAAKTALYLLLITGLFAACSNSTGSDDHEQEPVGIRIKSNGQGVLEYIAHPSNSTTTGSLSVTNGSTNSFTVVFLDEDLDEFTPEPDEHSITFSGAGNIAVFGNINSDSAPFSFDVTGTAEGSSTFKLTMNHQGAAEFVTVDLPISVTTSSN
jgi:hypothetical protein